jgi:hypothetical protein
MLQNLIIGIIRKFENKINEITSDIYNYLQNGDMKRFEEELCKECKALYKQLALILIMEASKSSELEEKARVLAQRKGLGEIRQKETTLQLRTGDTIRIFSWYALRSKSKRKKKKRGPNGSGCHLLLEYWGCILKASPGYYSYVTMLSILCPSFEIAVRVLKSRGIQAEYKRIREIAYKVGEKCFSNRIKIALKPGESLAGKRVVIGIDGGRTRIRKNNPKKKGSKTYKGKREKFDTPWREPKLFVIHILEKDGSTSKMELPIYDCLIKHASICFDLLKDYLKELQIEKASEIIFIADGAIWIWDRVKPMLISLGVDEEKLTEAVDYYHAVEHIAEIVKIFRKKQISKKEKKALIKELKGDLYNGKVDQVIEKITRLAKGRKKILKNLDYFKKNSHRMQYQTFRQRNLPCGSGIIESAIRRIINLRFKSPSSFWKDENVEKLIFLRGVFLAQRWNIMIKNLSQKNHVPIFCSMVA